MPTIFNAANEKAVAMFLDNKINYLEIIDIIQACMEEMEFIETPSLDNILETENNTYDFIGERW